MLDPAADTPVRAAIEATILGEDTPLADDRKGEERLEALRRLGESLGAAQEASLSEARPLRLRRLDPAAQPPFDRAETFFAGPARTADRRWIQPLVAAGLSLTLAGSLVALPLIGEGPPPEDTSGTGEVLPAEIPGPGIQVALPPPPEPSEEGGAVTGPPPEATAEEPAPTGQAPVAPDGEPAPTIEGDFVAPPVPPSPPPPPVPPVPTAEGPAPPPPSPGEGFAPPADEGRDDDDDGDEAPVDPHEGFEPAPGPIGDDDDEGSPEPPPSEEPADDDDDDEEEDDPAGDEALPPGKEEDEGTGELAPEPEPSES